MTSIRSDQTVKLAGLMDACPADLLSVDATVLATYSRDWTGDHFGLPLAVARPRSTAELSALMQYCHQHQIPVVPQGGLTGLVGAAVPSRPGGELVVSLERMNRVRCIDPVDYAMIVEAGCVLQEAKQQAELHDCILPITFGAQGSCRIGGNVSTNAGGFNVLRYGMTRDLVLGLEVVLADGRIWNGLRILRKDNRGYDLKQLFIGAEGTLGIVTAAALKLFPKPQQVETALLGLPSVEAALQLYARARRECCDLISAFELILRRGVDIAIGARDDLQDPLAQVHPVYVLMEASASGRIDLRGVLEAFLADAADLVQDGVLAATTAQAERLWLIRETMVEAQGRGGRYLRTDVSVAISRLAEFLRDVHAALAQNFPEAIAVTYGHIGDGNIHLNIVPPETMAEVQFDAFFHATEQIIFDCVDLYGGSISAEHGIGRVKQQAFLQRSDALSLELHQRIKDVFDPAHLLSAGRIMAMNENEDRK